MGTCNASIPTSSAPKGINLPLFVLSAGKTSLHQNTTRTANVVMALQDTALIAKRVVLKAEESIGHAPSTQALLRLVFKYAKSATLKSRFLLFTQMGVLQTAQKSIAAVVNSACLKKQNSSTQNNTLQKRNVGHQHQKISSPAFLTTPQSANSILGSILTSAICWMFTPNNKACVPYLECK